MVENRIVIYAPTGKDARLIASVLVRAEVECTVCARAADMFDALVAGAGALLVADEALGAGMLRQLGHFLAGQPSWSDLPILVMNQRVHASEPKESYLALGNVTLLERPLRGITLVSAAKSALRARGRQYAMREVDQRKDEFLAMLAHELRNPLAPVSAASDLLKMPNLDRAKIKHTSDIISRQVKHMTGLIDDLLDVSRVTRGLVSLDHDAVDARQVVTSAVEQVRPVIDARRHRLTVRTAPEPACIEGDLKRLVQVLANVLNNASKYTPDGGEIVLSMDVTAEHVQFTVSDNGMGMTPDVIAHVFEMFSQANRSSDRAQGGLGIGLALVKNLVQLHGGTVAASSAGLGQGSRFQLCFPRSHIKQPATAAAPDAAATPASHGYQVLIVDDNVDAGMMLGMFLEMAGYQVQVVHNASRALELVDSDAHYDACLLDIGLPDMDGNDLARRLRSLPATASAMLVAITGYGQEVDRQKTRAAGFDHHHVKPVVMDSLLQTLSTLH